MSAVSVYNEWDPLEEVIVGRAVNARIARPDHGLFAVEYRSCGGADCIPSGLYPQQVVDETEEDLDALIAVLRRLNIEVTRPEVWDHGRVYASPDWQTDGQYNFCPRDLFVALDRWLIEAPMTLRCRQYETLSYKKLLREYMRRGARWVSAPRPQLLDEAYDLAANGRPVLRDLEPIFDAANIVRLGTDVLYLVSDTGNRSGAQWLQQVLGDDYRVHCCEGVYSGSHVDTTISAVRPGLVVVSADRVGPQNLPGVFGGWDVIYLKDIVDIGYTGTAYASQWIGINFLMVNPALAIVCAAQLPLIRELEKRHIEVIPLRMRHARTLGGGFHCVTLDVRRRGGLEEYCRGARAQSGLSDSQ